MRGNEGECTFVHGGLEVGFRQQSVMVEGDQWL